MSGLLRPYLVEIDKEKTVACLTLLSDIFREYGGQLTKSFPDAPPVLEIVTTAAGAEQIKLIEGVGKVSALFL